MVTQMLTGLQELKFLRVDPQSSPISNHLRASGMAPVSLFDGQRQEPDD